VWVDGCESLLAGTDAEVPERFSEARDWLRARLAGVGPADSGVTLDGARG